VCVCACVCVYVYNIGAALRKTNSSNISK